MQNISLKIIQTEKKMTVITCAYMYMNNTIVKHHYSVHRTVIYSIHVQHYLFVCTGEEVVEDL